MECGSKFLFFIWTKFLTKIIRDVLGEIKSFQQRRNLNYRLLSTTILYSISWRTFDNSFRIYLLCWLSFRICVFFL